MSLAPVLVIEGRAVDAVPPRFGWLVDGFACVVVNGNGMHVARFKRGGDSSDMAIRRSA
jgi:hypothetical protein